MEQVACTTNARIEHYPCYIRGQPRLVQPADQVDASLRYTTTTTTTTATMEVDKSTGDTSK